MLPNYKELFPELPGTSRIWLYTSDKPFSDNDAEMVKQRINEFVASWAAHGKQLSAKGDLLLNRFVVLAADESVAGASGCSIDSSVHFLKELGKSFGVDFFNRMKLYILKNEDVVQIHIADLKEHENELLFDPMMADLADFRSNWIIPVRRSILYAPFR